MGLAGLCHCPFGEGCTAQNAGDRCVAPPRRSTPGSPSSCWALERTLSASCPAQNSRLAYHGVPGQPLGNGYAMRPRLTSTARSGSSLAPERCASIPMRATLCTFTTGSCGSILPFLPGPLNRGKTESPMRVYESDNIRNVGLIGHGASGKTSLTSAMLFVSGAVNRLGRVEDGNTVTDWEDEEIERKISISSALAYAEWNKHKINLLD